MRERKHWEGRKNKNNVLKKGGKEQRDEESSWIGEAEEKGGRKTKIT